MQRNDRNSFHICLNKTIKQAWKLGVLQHKRFRLPKPTNCPWIAWKSQINAILKLCDLISSHNVICTQCAYMEHSFGICCQVNFCRKKSLFFKKTNYLLFVRKHAMVQNNRVLILWGRRCISKHKFTSKFVTARFLWRIKSDTRNGCMMVLP